MTIKVNSAGEEQDCERLIYNLLEDMKKDFESVQLFMKADEECVNRLSQLDASCSLAMAQIAADLMQRSAEGDEYMLQVLCRALYRRGYPEVFELIAEALLSEQTVDKETYIDYLLEHDEMRAIPVLVRFIAASDRLVEDEEGLALAKAIDALRGHVVEGDMAVVIPKVGDESARVRLAAITLLRELNVRDASEAFFRQLEFEDDSINLESLLQGLIVWHGAAILPRLRGLLSSELVLRDESLRIVVEKAVASIE